MDSDQIRKLFNDFRPDGWNKVAFSDELIDFLVKYPAYRPCFAWRMCGRYGLSLWAISGITGLSAQEVKAQLTSAMIERPCMSFVWCTTTLLPVYQCETVFDRFPLDMSYPAQRYTYRPPEKRAYDWHSWVSPTAQVEEHDLLKSHPPQSMTEDQLRSFDPSHTGSEIYQRTWNFLKQFSNDPRW